MRSGRAVRGWTAAGAEAVGVPSGGPGARRGRRSARPGDEFAGARFPCCRRHSDQMIGTAHYGPRRQRMRALCTDGVGVGQLAGVPGSRTRLTGRWRRPGRVCGVVQRRRTTCRCQRRIAAGVIRDAWRRRGGSNRATAALTARSLQLGPRPGRALLQHGQLMARDDEARHSDDEGAPPCRRPRHHADEHRPECPTAANRLCARWPRQRAGPARNTHVRPRLITTPRPSQAESTH
jgi:hypothetical protein